MKLHMKSVRSLIVAFLFFLSTLLMLSSSAAATLDKSMFENINKTNLSGLSIDVVEQNHVRITGKISQCAFSVTGSLYRIYDSIDSNIIYFVEESPDYNASVCILNLEFETSANRRNLSADGQKLAGTDVVRVSAYSNGKFFYAEQSCSISSAIVTSVQLLSRDSTSPIMKTIISNASWHAHVKNQSANPITLTDIDRSQTQKSTPILGDSLDEIDIDILNKIPKSFFTREVYGYGWTDTGGYFIETYEWPSGSDSFLTYLLYYDITYNAPTSNSDHAQLQIQLIADRQFRYFTSSNTIEAYFLGTDFRIYDLKLAMACTQNTSGNGYDYVYRQSTSLTKNDGSHPAFTISKAIAMQFDKYGILSVADAIIDAFSEDDVVSGNRTCIWPSDYNSHYSSIANGKRANTMQRGIEIKTSGYLLNEEGATLLLEMGVVDRDYENSTTNISMLKSIKFAFRYNIRSRHPFYGWADNGEDDGYVSFERSRNYTK